MSVTLKKNDTVTLKTEVLLQNGNALAHTPDGFVVFVPGAAPDETVDAKIIKVTKSYAVAKITEIIQPSQNRIKDGCPYAGKCGGCVFCHIDYKTECGYKKDAINDAFHRIGGLDFSLSEFFPSKNCTHYRNKAIFPVGTLSDGTVTAGFYARNTHRIVPHASCLIGKPEFDLIKDSAVEFFNKNNISAYDEISGKGLVRSIYLRSSHTYGDISLTLILNGEKLVNDKCEKSFCGFITQLYPQIKTVLINTNTENSNAVLGKKWRTLTGEGCIYDELCGRRFRITPASFWQVNHDGTEILYSKAAEYAALEPGQTLIDLYCGTGTVGLCIADKDTRLYGAEIVEQAVADAKINAELNGINAEFLCLDAASALDDPKLKALKPDVITIDPPRKGCADAVEKIASLGARRIVYISCDPATLARDLSNFKNFGYCPIKAAGVDMFPRTGHVETVVLLSRETNPLTVEVRMEVETGEVKEHPTYKRIQEYVQEKYGFKVHTAYIAEVKRMVGLDMHKAPNAVEQRKHEYHPCPPEKVEAIKDALRHFGLVSE